MKFFGTDKNHNHAAFGELMPHTGYKENVCDANKFAKCVGGAGIIGKLYHISLLVFQVTVGF